MSIDSVAPQAASSPTLHPKRPVSNLTPVRKEVLRRPLPETPTKVPSAVKFDGWDTTHRLMRTLQERNQSAAISPADLEQIQRIAEEVISHANPKESLSFLKILSSYYVCGTKEIFFKVLSDLRRQDPRLDAFFKDVYSVSSNEGPSLTPHAMNELFHLYEEQFHFEPNVLSCQPLSRLTSLVDEFIEMPASDNPLMRGWTIFNDKISDDPHIVAVFMIRHQNKNHLFIFDSVGHDFFIKDRAKRVMSFSLNELIDHFKGRTDDAARSLTIYSCKPKRQSSNIGCATFATVDLKHLYEMHTKSSETIVDFYRSQRDVFQIEKVKVSEFPVYELYNFPPQMLPTMQSYKRLTRFNENPTVGGSDYTVERLSSSGDSLPKRVDLQSCMQTAEEARRLDVDDHAINSYIEQQRLKQIVALITQLFDPSDVQELSERVSSAAPQALPHPRHKSVLSRKLFADS